MDLGWFAEPLRDAVRNQAVTLARAAGLEVECIARRNLRQEDRRAAMLQRRGDHPGLGPRFSAMEPCPAFWPWPGQASGRTGGKRTQGQGRHGYFYFVPERLGWCSLRGPTGRPFRWQFYGNGHVWLANARRRAGLPFRMANHACVELADWPQAPTLAEAFSLHAWPAALDALARQSVPLRKPFPNGDHWSLMPVEYGWDLAWHRASAPWPRARPRSAARPSSPCRHRMWRSLWANA